MDKEGVSSTTKAAVALGELQFKNNYVEAQMSRAEWRRTLREVFKKVDFIAVPTLQQMPPRIPLFGRSGVFESRMIAIQNTVAVNFAGNPALAIPVPIRGKALPVTSLQLIGPPLSEAELLNAGRLIESSAGDSTGRNAG